MAGKNNNKKNFNNIRRRAYPRFIKKEKFKNDLIENSDVLHDSNDELIIPSFNIKYKCTFSDSYLISNDIETSKKKIKKKKKLKGAVVSGIFLLVFFIVLSVFCYFFLPFIKLNGKSTIIINYKHEYKEKGYCAKVAGKDITNLVKVSGNVNVNKLGEYKIVYRVKRGIFNIKRVRRVLVKDIEAPTISLKGDTNYYVCPGKKFKDPGYVIRDNYDKKLSNIKIKNKNNIYTYIVKDKSGNKSVVRRKVIYKDNQAPVIEFNGPKNVYVTLGEDVALNDVKSFDNCDGDLTNKLKIDGHVDSNKVGEYNITYTVKDKAGNKSIEKRKVFVTKKDAPGTIYLTFDDGPRDGTTNVILDILKEENVKATFFVTNGGPDELIIREHNEGHTVALHTYSHDYSYLYSSSENYFKDLYSIQDRVNRLIGVKPTIIRFPGGSSNTISRKYNIGIMSYLTKEVLNRGFKYYDWNLSSGDAGTVHDSDGVYNTVINNLSHDRVNMILMHDIKTYTRDALRRIIRYAKENGYVFDVIDDNTQMVTQRVNN